MNTINTRNGHPVMKENHFDPNVFAKRVADALVTENAFNKVETEYAIENNYFEPKDHGLKGDLVKRVDMASQGEPKTWEQKGDEFQKERDERFKEEKRQQKLRLKKTNKWLKDLEGEFEGKEGDKNV